MTYSLHEHQGCGRGASNLTPLVTLPYGASSEAASIGQVEEAAFSDAGSETLPNWQSSLPGAALTRSATSSRPNEDQDVQ
jgi:hypothetical protein